LRRRRKNNVPTTARAIKTKGIAIPIPILAPDDRPPDEFAEDGLLGDVFRLEVESCEDEVKGGEEVDGSEDFEAALTPITSVIAADFLSVNVNI
jgi:hypothetical protein